MKTLILSSLLLNAGLYAAEFKVTQSATKQVLPEYLRMGISVQSDCQATLGAAKSAVATYANKVVKILEDAKYVDPKLDAQLLAQPGKSYRMTKYKHEGNTSKPYCVDTWVTSNQITFKLSKIDLYDEVIEKLYAISDEATKGNSAVEGPQVVVSFGEPQAEISDKTLASVKLQAQKEAFNQAIGQFFMANQICPFGVQPELVSITMNNSYTMPSPSPHKSTSRTTSESAPMPVKLDVLDVTVDYSITIDYTPTQLDPSKCVQAMELN